MNVDNNDDMNDNDIDHDDIDDQLEALPDDLHEQITELCAKGDELMENNDFSAALELFQQAFNLIPEPIEKWESTLFVATAMGDACFFLNDFEHAYEHFRIAAINGGHTNPFICLRRGQCLFELGELDKAAEELARAYILDGREMFDNDNPKYLAFLATRLDPPEGQDTL